MTHGTASTCLDGVGRIMRQWGAGEFFSVRTHHITFRVALTTFPITNSTSNALACDVYAKNSVVIDWEWMDRLHQRPFFLRLSIFML